MTNEWHFYEPADGHRLAHDPLNAIVAPRPIGWISTVSADGVANLAPYSFFNLFAFSQAQLSAIARQLNERPRKTLNYQTPAETFAKAVATTG